VLCGRDTIAASPKSWTTYRDALTALRAVRRLPWYLAHVKT
jgi:hypothetical protein